VPEDDSKRRLGGYLMFCGMASLSVSSALWLTATSANPIGVSLAAEQGLKVDFGKWLLVASVPALVTIALLPRLIFWIFPPGVTDTPEAPAAARQQLLEMGPLSRDEWVTAVTFAVMVCAWIFAGVLKLNLTAVAIAGLGTLLATARAHAGGHLPAGQHAGHLSVAGGAVRAQRAAQRDRFHELRRASAWPRCWAASRGRWPMWRCSGSMC
jgi:di/tricarboxylate transporter